MLYLASTFAWFLLGAFALGLVMGWIGHDGEKLGLWNRLGGYAAGAAALAAVAIWLQALNGGAAVWLETALLFVAVYLGGCVLAATLCAALRPIPEEAAVAAAAAPSAEASATGQAATTLLKVEGEDAIPGQRPAGLVAARGDSPDDLKRIKGIGPQNEIRLHRLGIWHFSQIAAWTPQNIEWVGSYLAFPGRIEREDWVGQAKTLADKTLAAKTHDGKSTESPTPEVEAREAKPSPAG